jgi:hypothetical protein
VSARDWGGLASFGMGYAAVGSRGRAGLVSWLWSGGGWTL